MNSKHWALKNLKKSDQEEASLTFGLNTFSEKYPHVPYFDLSIKGENHRVVRTPWNSIISKHDVIALDIEGAPVSKHSEPHNLIVTIYAEGEYNSQYIHRDSPRHKELQKSLEGKRLLVWDKQTEASFFSD